MTKLPAALALCQRGFEVFPLTPHAKAPPLLTDWPNRAARTLEQVEALWAALPDANIAIHARGLLVLDVDVRSNGDQSYALLDEIHGFPHTLVTRTPSNGRHLFFRLAAGVTVSNSAGRLGPGLDIKTTGGYVVAPGSDTEAGRYHFEADVPIAPAPAWLLGLLGPAQARQRDATPAQAIPSAPQDSVAQARSWLASRPVGGGASYATACGLRDRGLSLAQALQVFEEHDPRPDAVEQVRHAYTYAQSAPGTKGVTVNDLPPPTTQDPAPVAKSTLLRLDELAARRTSSDYVVKGVLQRSSYALVYGDRGEGKTFVALDIAYCVAAGKPWMDHLVKPGPVLYLAFEGAGGLAKRAQALRKHYGDAVVPFYVDTAGYDLRALDGRRALGATVAALPEKPALIVIDTFAHALRGGDENSAQDVGAFNTAVIELIKATGACVLVVHHSGKNKANGPRGSSALGAAIDTEIEVEDRKITATKQRDIEPHEPIAFTLRPVPLDIDDDGDMVTSCVVMPAEATERAPALKGNAQLAFDALCRIAPGNEPVSLEEWREACAEFLGERQQAKKFYEARMAVLDRGYAVCNDNDMVTRRLE